MFLTRFLFVMVVLLYIGMFLPLDKSYQNRAEQLTHAPPVEFQRVVSGYLRQLVAELLFVKSSVFLGGVRPGVPVATYVKPLTSNFEVMTSLYPEFLDPYYYSQSYLTSISPESARSANRILEVGITIYPEDHILRFFHAFNYFRYLDEPLKAAKAFQDASNLPGAPPMFGHLAALFSAKGGNISAGLITLKAMLAVEKNKIVIARYRHEIQIFEKALKVNDAISLYVNKYQIPPDQLNDLVPEFLEQLPAIEYGFELIYEPPSLRLERL